jgi:RNA polymerase sigma-70 factor (ECF subfamily)
MQRVAAASVQIPYDEVADHVGGRLERQQVRRCLDGLTALQREAITLAYYGGHTYREVATLLDTALPTVKTRMRDGLIRLRDCLSVEVVR